MEGFTDLAAYVSAIASPGTLPVQSSALGLSGLGDVLALIGVVAALVPLALAFRAPRPWQRGASLRERGRVKSWIAAAVGSLNPRWSKAPGRG
jgi:hypothetical protein